jgi:hypothetical protein
MSRLAAWVMILAVPTLTGTTQDALGGKVEPEFRVNTTTARWQNHPSTAKLANGGFVVTWDGQESGGSGDEK